MLTYFLRFFIIGEIILNGLIFNIKNFTQLKNEQIYQILKLRQDVFILEQQSFYHDIDGNDEAAQHCFFEKNGEIKAYLRLIKLDSQQGSEAVFNIGRFVIQVKLRAKQLGHVLFMQVIDHLNQNYDSYKINISAQLELRCYYEKLGFLALSTPPYDDGGVMHIDMSLNILN